MRAITRRRRAVAVSAACATIVAAWGLTSTGAVAQVDILRTTLLDPSGREVGKVTFRVDRHHTRVSAAVRPNPYVAPGAFHGFHLHANNDPANGSGCIADPSQPAATWFVAVDGHLADPGQGHGHHRGDLPSPRVSADGTARVSFTIEWIEPADLVGRAVVLHAGPDNFGSIPIGVAPDQYTANSASAVEKTHKTGNAGDRVACGLITGDPRKG